MGLYERLLEERASLPERPGGTEAAGYPPERLAGPEYRGLYGRLLRERADEEQRTGRPLGRFYGWRSEALERAMDRRPGRGGEIHPLYRLVHTRIGSPGRGMRYMSLKRKYPEEYAEIMAEKQGQGELLQGLAHHGGLPQCTVEIRCEGPCT